MQVLSQTAEIDLHQEGEVLYVTLNRPDVRNAMNLAMVEQLTTTFASLPASATRAVVLRGAAGNFCAGGDIKDMSALLKYSKQKEIDAIVRFSASAGELFHMVNQLPQAVIAILEGAVVGGGMGLACVADICIAHSSARFGLPETSLGILPAQVAPFIRQRLGESKARLLAVLGGTIDAALAYQLGLVHYLTADDANTEELLADVLAKIRACAPGALAQAKQLMMNPSELQDPQALAVLFAQSLVGAEAAEGTAAFMEKRKPVWNQ